MKICEKCGKEFPNWTMINGVKKNLHSRKYCLDCSPFGEQSGGRKVTKINDYGFCLYCGNPLKTSNRKFCNNHCQQNYMYQEYIEKWKNGEISGTKGEKWIDVSNYIRRYLLGKI